MISSDQIDSDVIAMARSRWRSLRADLLHPRRQADRARVLHPGRHRGRGRQRGDFASSSSSFTPRRPPCRPRCYCPNEIEEAKIIKAVAEHAPRRPKSGADGAAPRHISKTWCKMATENATETLRALKTQWQADTNKQTEALAELQQALQLANPPNRIECYDISNTQGTASVGSMVVFEQGVPSKKPVPAFQHPDRAAGRMISPAWKKCSRGASAAGRRPRSRPRTRRAANLTHPSPAARPADRGRRQGPAGPGGDGAGAVRVDRQGAGGRAGQTAGRAVPAGV